jgi:hypothetical protein
LAAKAEDISHSFGIETEWAIRVDVNISSGIVRAAKEMLASKIIMGWSGKTFHRADGFLGQYSKGF